MLKASLLIHILSAAFWIGSMLFFVLILAPFLKTINKIEERTKIYETVGKRYRFWGWLALALLIATGWLNIYLMGISFNTILTSEFYNSHFGKSLTIKLLLVLSAILISFAHDFVFGPNTKKINMQ